MNRCTAQQKLVELEHLRNYQREIIISDNVIGALYYFFFAHLVAHNAFHFFCGSMVSVNNALNPDLLRSRYNYNFIQALIASAFKKYSRFFNDILILFLFLKPIREMLLYKRM